MYAVGFPLSVLVAVYQRNKKINLQTIVYISFTSYARLSQHADVKPIAPHFHNLPVNRPKHWFPLVVLIDMLAEQAMIFKAIISIKMLLNRGILVLDLI